MANLYSIEITICATSYVKADSADEALRIARERFEAGKDGFDLDDNPEIISGLDFGDPDLPDISVSPAMTFQGIWPGDVVQLAEEDV